MDIRHCEPGDAAQVCEIYNHYIRHTTITFEEVALTEHEMQARIDACTQRYPWLVCVDEGRIVGYAYASKWKVRAAYRHTAETTIYIRDAMGGKGYGKALYTALIAQLSQSGCHVALGCIALPNEASVGLHAHFGFKQVAHFPEVGRKFDRWLDVGYWQKTLDHTAPTSAST